MRCSGDPGCCRRCFSKRFACEYPSPVWSSSGSSQIQSSQPKSTKTTVTSQISGLNETLSVPDSIHDFGILDLPTPGPGHPNTPTDGCDNHHLAEELKSLRRTQQQHQHMSTTSTQDTYTFDADLATDIGDLVFDSPISLVAPKTPTNTSSSSAASTSTNTLWPCSCLHQAMAANEAVEIISWSQRDSCRDVYDVLQQQKAALARCEGLLGCQECTVQPSYVMMLLSMCQKLSDTLEKISRGADEEEDDREDGAEQRKRNRGDSYESRSGVVGGNGKNSSAAGTTSQRYGYGISIREQRLDDDDESLVLKSLVVMRVKMLRRIVGRVDEMMSSHNWPVHKGVCRELRSLLDSLSIT